MAHLKKQQARTKVIYHIPHSSTLIPPDLRSGFLLDDQAHDAELLAMTDAYTDNLFGSHAGRDDTVVTFPVSRLVVDPERFLDDAVESMARVGMGVIYQRTSDGVLLRNPPSAVERASLIQRFYESHHERLTKAVARGLANSGAALVLDCHSFPSRPLPYELDQDPHRPDICIGTDAFHTPDRLVEVARRAVADEGLTCRVNRPFAGTMVPS